MSDKRPSEASIRPDALGSSRHSRLADQLQEPAGKRDLEAAAAVCAEISRAALGDFAPALVLLSSAQRRRVQALTAYAVTLFDFARQRGLDGERLAQINRWEFDLESALDDDPPAQPVFLLLAHEQRNHPWPDEGFERLNGSARRRVATRRPATVEDSERETIGLSRALCLLLLGPEHLPGVERLANAVLRTAILRSLGEGLRRQDSRLSQEVLPDAVSGLHNNSQSIEKVIAVECAWILREIDRRPDNILNLDRRPRRSMRYLQLASRQLLRQIERLGADILECPPRLGIGTRLILLARARLSGF